MITSVLQEAFLRKDCLKDSLGIDFYDKEQLDLLIVTCGYAGGFYDILVLQYERA